MGLPRFRMTVRWMMAVVAIVAVAFGMVDAQARWRRLSRLYEIRAGRLDRWAQIFEQSAAKSHDQWVAECRAIDEQNRRGGGYRGIPAGYGWHPAEARRIADHQRLLARKYHRASRQPWWPVEPDPPLPNQ